MQKALSLTLNFSQNSYPSFILNNAKSYTVPASNRVILCRNLFTGISTIGDLMISGDSQNRNNSLQQQQQQQPQPRAGGSFRTTSSLSVSGSDILASFSAQSKATLEGTDVAGAMEALANADAVCFDVDSTVITEEGIVSIPYYRILYIHTFDIIFNNTILHIIFNNTIFNIICPIYGKRPTTFFPYQPTIHFSLISATYFYCNSSLPHLILLYLH